MEGEGFEVATRVYQDMVAMNPPDRITLTSMIECVPRCPTVHSHQVPPAPKASSHSDLVCA
jgi:hypothetical protein